MDEEEIRLKVLQEVQTWIDSNSVYQVVFGHYNYDPPHEYGQWITDEHKRINLLEALNADKTRRPTLREG